MPAGSGKVVVHGSKSSGGLEDLLAALKDEYTNEAKFAANLKLFRALAVFAGGIIVARSFGEALFVG
jgi:hypothetical protein